MDLTPVSETLFNALSVSSILILTALGLSITFGVMKVINMAHGEMLMLGAYTAFLVEDKSAIPIAVRNWGRILSAAGYAGVVFEEEQLSLWIGDLLLYDHGTPQPFDAAAASAYLKNNRDISLRLRFTLGSGRCTFWTSDLTYDYVKLNADYTT